MGMENIAAKLSRARQDLRAFYDAYHLAIKADPVTFGLEPHAKSGEYGVKVHHVSTVGPELTVILGDVIHNFRSALDQLAWTLALTQVTKPFGPTAYPITKSPREFGQYCHLISDLTPSQQAIIEQFQPYNRPDWLVVLRQLSNTDKHRGLNAALVVPTLIGVSFEGVNCDVVRHEFTHVGHRMKVGTEFAVLELGNAPSEPHVKMKGHLIPEVAFADVSDDGDVLTTCLHIGGEILLICRQFQKELGPPAQGWPNYSTWP